MATKYIPPAQRKKLKIHFSKSWFLLVGTACLTVYGVFSTGDAKATSSSRPSVQQVVAKTTVSGKITAKSGTLQPVTLISAPNIPAVVQNLPILRQWPVRGRITTYFNSFHQAVDLANPKGTPIRSFAAGVVINVGHGGSFGNYLEIAHNNNLVTTYAHMSSISVVQGQQVELGTVIGAVGSTGNSTGPHLHFQVAQNGRNINPLAVLP